MVQLHAIMGGLDVRPATDADLLGALILKSAAYQADHAGYGDRHLYDAAMLASLITDPDAETRRLHSHTDRRRIKLPYDMLTDESPYWNNLDEQHRRIRCHRDTGRLVAALPNPAVADTSQTNPAYNLLPVT